MLWSWDTRADDEVDDVPYIVEVDNFEISTEYDTKYIDWDTLGLKKKGRNQFVVGGSVTLNLNLADEQKINIQIFPYDKERKAKGPLIFNLEKEICKFIAEDEDMYPGVKEKSNLPDPGTCPVPKGEYTIDDYEVQADFLPDDIPKGDYLLVFLLKDGITPVAGFTALINISD
ncbi:chemosensory protein A 7a [Cochliomyia hominivorax]